VVICRVLMGLARVWTPMAYYVDSRCQFLKIVWLSVSSLYVTAVALGSGLASLSIYEVPAYHTRIVPLSTGLVMSG
jgi:hypothetical protein